jgi:hypothetical protein
MIALDNIEQASRDGREGNGRIVAAEDAGGLVVGRRYAILSFDDELARPD